MYLLFDIGGTKTRIAVSEDLQKFSEPKILPTPKKYEEGIALFIKTAQELSGGKNIEGIVGGIAGPFDEKKRALVASPQLKDWIGKPLKQELEKKFSAPVYIENDSALAGLGEAHFGAGKGKRIVAYITVSTGLGGARIVNGVIDEKAIGFEPGFLIVDADNSLCSNCDGNHLGAMINGRSFEKRFGKKGEEIDDPKIWDEAARVLAYGLNNVAVLWSPDIIVLGGSVMKSLDIKKIESYLINTLKIFPEIPEIKPAELGDFGGLWGAMELLMQNK